MSAIESLDLRCLGASYVSDAPVSSSVTAVAVDAHEHGAAVATTAVVVAPASPDTRRESQPDASEFSRLGAALRSLTTLRIGDPPADPRLSFSAFTRLRAFSALSLYVQHLAQLPALLTSLHVSDRFLSLATGPGVTASDGDATLALALLTERAVDLVELRVPTVPLVAALLESSRPLLSERLQRLECGRQRYTRVHNDLNYSMACADALLGVRRLKVHNVDDRRALATLVDAPAPRLEHLTLDVHSVSRLFCMPGTASTAKIPPVPTAKIPPVPTAKIPPVPTAAAAAAAAVSDVDTVSSTAAATGAPPARPNLRKFVLCAPRSVCADALRRIDAPHLTAIHLEMAAEIAPPTAEEKTREVLWATVARAAAASSPDSETALRRTKAFSAAAARVGISDFPSSARAATQGTAAEFAPLARFARLETLKLNFARAPVSALLADWLSSAAPLAALTDLELARYGTALDASALDERIVPRLRVLRLRGRVAGICGTRLPRLAHLAAFNLVSGFVRVDGEVDAAAVAAPADPGWIETFPRLERLSLMQKPWCHVATRTPEFARLLARLRARGVAIAYEPT